MNNSIDQQFVEFIVTSLVGNPAAVHINRSIDEKGVLLELTVDPEDLGRVIGKRGATAQSLRTLLRALGTKNEARYNLKIVDNGIESQGSPSSTAVTDQPSTTGDDASLTADLPEPTPEVQSDSDRLSRTRRELAEFDDLDV